MASHQRQISIDPHLSAVPWDLPDRLEWLRDSIRLSWDGMASYLGVSGRVLSRWRARETVPSGPGMFAIFRLAAKVPGGLDKMLAPDSSLARDGFHLSRGALASHQRQISIDPHLSAVPWDLPDRIEWLRDSIGLSWDGMASYLGFDGRVLSRWRARETLPSGPGVFAIFRLAAKVPGGLDKMLAPDSSLARDGS